MRLTAKRAVSVVFLFILATAVALAAAVYSLNWHRQSLAAQLIRDAARLKPGANISDVLSFANRYGATVSASSQRNSCTPSDCLVWAGVPSDTAVKGHPKLNRAYEDILRRSWQYAVSMWVKDGKLTGNQQWFSYSTPSRDLAVITETSTGSARLCRHPSYVLHNTYSVEMAPHHFNVWVSLQAKDADVISHLNISCVSALRGCRSVSEMAPEAWQRYQRDQPVLRAESEVARREASASCAVAFDVP
jgi:hypothetical protein